MNTHNGKDDYQGNDRCKIKDVMNIVKNHVHAVSELVPHYPTPLAAKRCHIPT